MFVHKGYTWVRIAIVAVHFLENKMYVLLIMQQIRKCNRNLILYTIYYKWFSWYES